MIKLGEKQELKVVRSTKNGLYLSTSEENIEDVLLPNNQIGNLEIGDVVEVFIYKDSEDRLIATTKNPKITLGQIATLKVKDITEIGAFLDWGLDKDLFLPHKEQLGKIKKDGIYVVGMYIDKSDRLSATMKISRILESDSPYKVNDRVKGIVYSINKDLGAFVAVEDQYTGRIPKEEQVSGLVVYGERVEARIKRILSDGKLELSLRKEGKVQRHTDAEKIYEELIKNGGNLPLNDNSSPEEIKRELNMSKGAFKRAVGGLLKEGKIELSHNGIRQKF